MHASRSPELNVAWFNEPAARAMLMHTRVYGDYHGPEDVIQRTECYTEINVVGNYAPVRQSVVTVVDTEGKACCGRDGRVQDIPTTGSIAPS